MGRFGPTDFPPTANSLEEKSLPSRRVAVVGAAKDLPFAFVAAHFERADVIVEQYAGLCLDRQALGAERSPILELGDVFDHEPSDVELVQPVENEVRLGAGLVATRPAATGDAVMCARRRRPQQVEPPRRHHVGGRDRFQAGRQVPCRRVVRPVRFDGDVPMVDCQQPNVFSQPFGRVQKPGGSAAGAAKQVGGVDDVTQERSPH